MCSEYRSSADCGKSDFCCEADVVDCRNIVAITCENFILVVVNIARV